MCTIDYDYIYMYMYDKGSLHGLAGLRPRPRAWPPGPGCGCGGRPAAVKVCRYLRGYMCKSYYIYIYIQVDVYTLHI